MPIDIKPKTELARRLLGRLQDRGLTVSQLADRLELKYETLRKIFKGDRPPTKRLLRDLTRELVMDHHELEVLVVVDRLRQDHPGVLLHIAGIAEPEIIAISRQWALLSIDQREQILWLVEKFVAKNRERTDESGQQLRPGKPH